MKKIFAVCCALCIALLSACTNETTNVPSKTASDGVVSTQTTETPTQAQTPQTETTEALTPAQTEAPTEPVRPAKAAVRLAESLQAIGTEDYISAVEDTSESAVHLVFTVDQTVRDVRVLSLMMTDYDEATGKPVYDMTVLEALDAVTPQKPLVITTVFYGDLPNNGIAYTDTDGTFRRFAIEMSGEDGSVFLSEF